MWRWRGTSRRAVWWTDWMQQPNLSVDTTKLRLPRRQPITISSLYRRNITYRIAINQSTWHKHRMSHKHHHQSPPCMSQYDQCNHQKFSKYLQVMYCFDNSSMMWRRSSASRWAVWWWKCFMIWRLLSKLPVWETNLYSGYDTKRMNRTIDHRCYSNATITSYRHPDRSMMIVNDKQPITMSNHHYLYSMSVYCLIVGKKYTQLIYRHMSM